VGALGASFGCFEDGPPSPPGFLLDGMGGFLLDDGGKFLFDEAGGFLWEGVGLLVGS